jgi:hypothetical protein
MIARRILPLAVLLTAACVSAWGQTTLPTVIVSGLPTIGVAATQPTATVSLSAAYPLNVTVTMALTFTPTGGSAHAFDAKFAIGGTTTTFVLSPAVSTASVPVMIGTVAGIITITTNAMDSAGNSLTPVPVTNVMTVNPTVPVINNAIPCAITLTGFSIVVTGRSTPRDMTSALFHFTLPSNTQPPTLDVTVPLTAAFAGWYNNPNSNAFGSTFKMTVQFAFKGPPGSTVPFIQFTTTLTNSAGASTPPDGQPPVATCP